MLKKSLNILKSNPVIILFYTAFLVVTLLILFALYPKNFSQFTNPDVTTFDFAAYLSMMGKMFICALLMYVLGLLFYSGFGNMMTEAVMDGKTSANSFLPGIRNYFGRILLASLLLIAFSIGFSIVISIVTVPIMLLSARNESVNSLSLIISIISSLVVVLVSPFFLLWCPSIFIDDTGMIQGLVKGAKAGVKNYWKLLLILLILYIPVVANIIFSFKSIENGNIFTPGYLIIGLLTVIISFVSFPIFFLIYKENKPS
jgi:hypothetical protein